MSFLGKVFSGKKNEKKQTPAETIQKLREAEEMFLKKQEYLEKKIEQELSIVKKNGISNKRLALQALRRKKRYEKQLQQIDGTLSTIETQREVLESANQNTAVLQTMKLAADTLKQAHQKMDIDDVHDMLDVIAEQQDIAKEISGAISNPIALGSDLDDDELEKELEQLEQEELDKELLGTAPTPSAATNLPPVATVAPPVPKVKPKPTEDDEDLKLLEQWAT